MSPISTTDIISIFQKAEKEISEQRGGFTLFGLFERTDIYGKYDCVISAPWLEDAATSVIVIADLVRTSIGNDKWWSKIGIFMTVPENGPFAAAVREALQNGPVQHGIKRLTNFFYDGEIIRDAVIITSMEPAAEAEQPKRRARTAETVPA